jgi:hypothetical protein
VFFECSDGSLSGVAAVTVGWYQLVIHVIGGEKVLQMFVDCIFHYGPSHEMSVFDRL